MSKTRLFTVSAIVFALAFPTLITWIYFVVLADRAAKLQHFAYCTGKITQFAFPLLWVIVVQHRPLSIRWPKLRGIGVGLGSGVLVLVALLAIFHAVLTPLGFLDAPAEQVRQKVAGFGVNTFRDYILLAAFYALGHSLLEEYYWRWFVFGQLRDVCPIPLAILISSMGFMAHHVLVLGTYFGWLSPATVVFSLAVAVGGAFWAWLYHRYESLVSPWISHAVVDIAIFVAGYDMARELIE